MSPGRTTAYGSPSAEVGREMFGRHRSRARCDAHRPRWALYLSCATPESKHWWIEALDARTPEGFGRGRRRLVLPGDRAWAVKDPVILRDGPLWHMWVCCHPLQVPGAEDRMVTRHAISRDGLSWTDRGEVLRGTPGSWDERGARGPGCWTRHADRALRRRATAAANCRDDRLDRAVAVSWSARVKRRSRRTGQTAPALRQRRAAARAAPASTSRPAADSAPRLMTSHS